MIRYLVMLLAVMAQLSYAQKAIVDSDRLIAKEGETHIVQIDRSSIQTKLMSKDISQSVVINIPYISDQDITLEYHDMLSDDFKSNYPDIRIYKWKNASSRGRITVSPEALYINKFDQDGLTMLYPTADGSNQYYVSNSHDEISNTHIHECEVDRSREAADRTKAVAQTAGARDLITNGNTLRTYRMAPIVTGEYYQANGGSNATVVAHLTNGVSLMEDIFENDIAVNFTLLTPVLYNNPGNDPFEPDQTGGDGRVAQAVDAITDVFNSANYDLGHVFHHHQTDDGWSTGGVAFRGAVCIDQGDTKAGGWSGSFNNNGVGWIQLACHELGHMFGAQHTFNGEGESCDAAISGNAAYEIGSGTTIMSYQGICGDGQNITASGAADSYFHVHSLLEMVGHMEVFGDCANESSTNNNPPTIDPNPCNLSYQIPRGTPFIMTADANDPDGDPLTFVWEQYDEDGTGTPTQGEIGAQASGNTVGPNFRSFPPSSDITRSFPDRATVINGNGTDPFQALPGTGRMLNFKITARDNQLGGGAIAIEDRQVQVVTSGPFRVTNPNTNINITAGDPLDITWSTGGSDDVCAQVDIYLSIDGGFSTPFLLANDVDYASASTTVNIPSSISETDQARVMIICDDNPCVQIFDLSNNDFRITSGCRVYQSYVCETDQITADQGDPSLDLMMTSINGEVVSSITSDPITQNSERMDMSVFNTSGSCTEMFEFFYESVVITPTTSGTYTFNSDIGFGGTDAFGFFSIFTEDGFSTSNPCSSFVTSSGTNPMGNQVSSSPSTSVDLEACTRYVIAFYNYGTLPISNRLSSITGPGEIILGDGDTSPDYDYTYVAVNTVNDIVAATSPTGDFRTLGGGVYDVYGVSYKIGGMAPPANTDPATWPGQSITALIFSGNCILQSQNSRAIEIISTCSIDAVSNGSQSDCNPITNEYTQDLIIDYSSAPTTGNLIVNGANFPLTGSPQGVILENLISDGQPVDVTVSFSDDSSCESIFPVVFTAPENCCPITLDLGEDQTTCVDDNLMLDAGPDGATYEWTINDIALPDTERSITPTSTGVYRVTVTNADGCAKTDEVSLVINPNPEILLNGNSSQCEGELATLNPNVGAPDFTYSWTRDGTFVAGSEIIEVSIAGEYCIEVTNPFSGCSSTACTTVEFVDAPDVELGDDLIGCAGDQFELDAGTDGSSYQWLKDDVVIDNETNQLLTVIESGTYIARVSEGLCTTEDTITVTLTEAPTIDFEISNSFTLCEGTTETTNITGSFDEYTITLDGDVVATGTDPTYTIEAGGEYIITATNTAGCTSSDTTTANESPVPVVDFGDDKIGCIGSDVLLDAGMDGAEYIWFFGNDLLPETGSQITVSQSGLYSVIVSNDVFCTATDEVNVDFLPGPTLDIGESFDLCEGNTQTVTANTDGDNITWYRDGAEIIGETDFTIEISESGTYLAEVAGTSGCTVEDQIVVNVFENPTVNIDPTRTICEGEETTIVAGDENNNYLWTDAMGMTVSQDPEFTTSTAGLYTVFVTNINNCFVSTQVEVIVVPFPVINIDDTAVYCEGSSTTLVADVTADSYAWEKDGELISSASDPSLEVSEAGIYTITATNGTSCISSASIDVTEIANPSFDLGDDLELCPGDNTTLTITEDGTYEWSTTETSQSITIDYDDLTDTETVITAMLTTTEGCVASDEITITRLTNPTPIVAEEATICQGDTITLMVTASDGSPTDSYQWSGPDGTFSSMTGSSIEVWTTEDATYTVTVVNGCGISMDQASTMVFVDQPAMDLSAGRDTCVINGRSINLSATGGESYQWVDDGTFVGATTGSSPSVMPSMETTYTVEITNENGCTYTDEVTICIIEDPFSLIQPISLITPNGDGMNDVLEFRGLEAFPDNRLRIYNRWGQVIFDRDGYQNGDILFDGSRGTEGKLPPDTYYYILEIDDKVVFKQNLTIVRN